MATAEAASDALGPRYAPDDPTLPKPWTGLIDGSTGMLYYWNPETNITQYEKPAALPPPLPLGPPSVASTPKLAPIPNADSMPPNGLLAQHGQQILQASQQLSQQVGHLSQQHMQTIEQQQSPIVTPSMHHQASQMSQAGQQQNSHSVQSRQHQGLIQQKPQVLHHPSQQMHQHSGQQVLQQMGQQMPPQGIQSQQFKQGTPQNEGSHIRQQQAHQFTHQHMHYFPYQQGILPAGQQIPHNPSAQPFESQQEFKAALPKMEEMEFQIGNQVGFSPSKFQQKIGSSVQSNQNIPTGFSSGSQIAHIGTHPGQSQQHGVSLPPLQQSPSMLQSQRGGSDSVHQHGSRFQNQISSAMVSGQPSNVHPVGLKMGREDNLHGRAGGEYYYNSNKEGPMLGPQHPNIAPLPIPRNQQDVRISSAPFQKAMSGPDSGSSGVTRHAMHSMYNHAVGGPPLSSTSLVRPAYVGSSDVTELSPAEVYRQQHEVTATGGNIPAPFMTFESAGLPPEILREIYSAGFSIPTPIQAQTWPVALESRDIVAIAKTGSGKTLGYLMPAFMLLRQRRNNPQNGPTVLVLAPTRELATQIQDEAVKFGRSSRVSCTCLYGGASKATQLQELDRGADIVVATPGRLNDILEMKKINFGQVSLLVLDEADRMLDMGFEPQIRKIVNEIPPRRQTLMYTATWPKEVRKIASDLLVDPVQVNIGSVDELAANKAITQYVELVPQMEKQRRLEQILRAQERGSKVIVFCSTKRLCDQLARSIGYNFGAAAIHGDKSQGERDWVLNQFRSGKSPILVATDVAARGLDIKDIRVVINYDFPTGIEDYVHRIGRTGRAGATGISYTFISEQDRKHAADLIKVLEGANQLVPPEIREMALRGPPNFGKDRSGMKLFDSGSASVASRWDSGGRGGMRDGGFGGRSGLGDGDGFGGRGGMRDGGFGGRGGMRDGGFGGRGGMRDVGGHGGRGDFFSGRGNRGRGSGGPGGGHLGWGRSERGPHDRYNNLDGRGWGRGRGRGRFDDRRYIVNRSRDRSYSRSRSRSRSLSRGRSRSRSWSRDRSYSRSRSRSNSSGRSCDRGHSRSRSYDRYVRPPRVSKFDVMPTVEAPASGMSSISQGTQDNTILDTERVEQLPVVNSTESVHPDAVVSLTRQSET